MQAVLHPSIHPSMWRSTPSGRPFPTHDNDRKSRLDVHNVPCGRDKMHGDTVWNQGPLYSSEWSVGYGEERCKVKDECTVSGTLALARSQLEDTCRQGKSKGR